MTDDEARRDENLRLEALKLAVEATSRWTTTKPQTLRWAECFYHYVKHGTMKVAE